MKRLIILIPLLVILQVGCDNKSGDKIEDENQKELRVLDSLKKEKEIEKLRMKREIDSLQQVRDSLKQVDSLTLSLLHSVYE